MLLLNLQHPFCPSHLAQQLNLQLLGWPLIGVVVGLCVVMYRRPEPISTWHYLGHLSNESEAHDSCLVIGE
jgi:hypothetical protein